MESQKCSPMVESFVVPAIRVLSPAWAPRGLHRAMFMNSVCHGKVWTENAASPLEKPCFAKEWMLGGYLSKNLSPPPPPPLPSKLPIRTHNLLSKSWAVGGRGWGGHLKAGQVEKYSVTWYPPPTNQPNPLALDTSQSLTREVAFRV
jgi:hypothetical protein